MKKLLYIIMGIIIFLSILTVCYAGSVPEDLLYEDYTLVYFGKVKNIDGDSITVIQQKNIKGEFTQDSELIYKRFVLFTNSPKIGETYLCGYYDENNPLYMWDVTSLDTKTLKIKSTDSMSKRMQEFLNDGKFEEKENEKLTETDTKDNTGLSTSESKTVMIADNTDQTHNDSNTVSSYMIILILSGTILIGIIFFVRTKRKK